MEVRRLPKSELYHHGIKGQEWGVKNGPPYPLNASGRSLKKQKRLYKHMQTLNDADRRIGDKIKKRRYVKKHNQEAIVDRITDERNYKTTAWYNAKMKAVQNKDYKKTNEYKQAKKAYIRQFNRDFQASQKGNYGAAQELHEINHAHNKLVKIIKKYEYMKVVDVKPSERQKAKIKKVIDKVNKINMEYTNSEISDMYWKNGEPIIEYGRKRHEGVDYRN